MDDAGLAGYLDRFQKETGLEVIIKDFIGLFEMDERLFEAVQNFYIHKSPYCMAIKGNQRLWDYCLLEKKLIYRKLMREPVPFFGFCYAGVGEYIIPVLHEGTVIAALAIGSFRSEQEWLTKKWDRFAGRYGLDICTLSKGYTHLATARIDTYAPPVEHQRDLQKASHICRIDTHASTRMHQRDLSLLRNDRIKDMEPYGKQLEIVVEYLRLVHAGLNRRDSPNPAGVEPAMNRSYTLSHAMEYLRLHHAEEVTLADLSAFCHCSKSYISHQFRRYTQMTMKTYINQLRVNTAKELMKRGKSVIEAAYSVGFRDSNYFSKVFKELEHKTPTEYLRE